MEIGPKDVKNKQVVLVRRDNNKKEIVKVDNVVSKLKEMIDDIHKSMFNKALDFLKSNTHKVKTYNEFKTVIKKGGIIQSCWCGERKCEDKVKDDTGTKKIINISEQEKVFCDCILCGKKAKVVANFAKSY
jgi:prolyl-tRNA synthetase